MPSHSAELPKTGFAIEIDGRLKTEFTTKEGAEQGATELKRRFPMLQVRIYDAVAQTRHESESNRAPWPCRTPATPTRLWPPA